jgi:hypothetical protein
MLKGRIFVRTTVSFFVFLTTCWNFDFLLRLWIKARARLPLLLHQLTKTGQNEFTVLFDRFVGDVAERIEECSSGSFVGLGAAASAT